jgi:hypothetical protein
MIDEEVPNIPLRRGVTVTTLRELTPIWAVGPECACISLRLIQCTEGRFTQWGVLVASTERPPFLIMSPLLIRVVDEISIGSDAREPIQEPVLEEFKQHFHGAETLGCFHSGPLAGLFPHSAMHKAWECLRQTHDPKHSPWEETTRQTLGELVSTYRVPYLRFRTYDEVRVRCGVV